MRARAAWTSGIAALSAAIAIVGCRGLAGVEDAYLIDDAGTAGASQGGSAGQAGAAGGGQGGTAGEGQGGAAGGGQGGEAGQAGMAGQAGAPGCKPPEQDCGGVCVNTNTDPKNCGKCGNVCSVPGDYCIQGICSPCMDPSQVCGDQCVDTYSDRLHCGFCNNACPNNSVCEAGSCNPCPGGWVVCNNTCADLQKDNANCGWCQHNCQGKNCIAGLCEVEQVASCNGSPTSIGVSSMMVVHWTAAGGAKGFVEADDGVNTYTVFQDAGLNPLALSVDPFSQFIAWGAKNPADSSWYLHGGNSTGTASYGEELFSVPIDGDPFETILLGGFVYWTRNGGSSLWRRTTDQAGDVEELINNLDQPMGLVSHASDIYVATGTEIVRLPSTGSPPLAPYSFAIAQNRPLYVAKAGPRIVWSNLSAPGILGRLIDGNEDVQGVLISNDVNGIMAMTARDDIIYFYGTQTSTNQTGIFAVPAYPGSGPVPLAITSVQAVDIALDDSWVYWASMDQTILRVPR